MRIRLSENKQKIANNMMWAVSGKIINLAGTLILGIIIARYLGAEQYGLMNYVISYAFLFQTLASFGIDSIEVREEAAGNVPYTTIIGTAFWIKVVFGIICIGLSVGTALIIGEDSYTTLLILMYSCYIVFNSFGVIRNYFTSLVQNKYVVLSEIFRTFVGIAIKLTLWIMDCSLTWFIAAFAFDYVLLAGGYISSYRHKIGRLRDWKFSMPYARFMLKESFPLLLTNAAVIIYQRIDQVMIGQMVNKTEVGYFSVAAKFVEVMIFIPATIAQTISPMLVQFFQKSKETYLKNVQRYLNIMVWLCLLCSIAMSVVSYWVVLYTFGTEYLPAAVILQVLAFKMVSAGLSSAAGSIIIVERLQKWVFFRDILGCIVCVGLNWWLLPKFGAVAAAFVAIAANIAAGYIADVLVPAYRHIFRMQTKAILLGWRELASIPMLLKH